MKRSSRLVVPAFAMLATTAVAAMSSCSSGSEAQSLTTVTIGQQSYSQRAPATTTTTIPLEDARPGDVVHEEQQYTIQPNDGLSVIANRYGVTVAELAGYNGWVDGVNHRINPGETIRIPPGAIYVDEDALTTTTTSTPLAGEEETAASTTDATAVEDTAAPPTNSAAGDTDEADADDGGDECVAGTYVVRASDSTRLAVAERFDVTVEALDEINADTPGYSSFYPGLEILVPESSDC